MSPDHLPPTDHDGTAIDWDTEAQATLPDVPGARVVLASMLVGLALSGLVALALTRGWIVP